MADMRGSGRAWPRTSTLDLPEPAPSTLIDQSPSPPAWNTLTSGTALRRRRTKATASSDEGFDAARRAPCAAAPDMTARV